MVNRREKTRRELYRAQEQVFWKQVEILTDDTRDPSKEDIQWVIEAGRGNFSGNGSSSPGGGSKSQGSDGGSGLWGGANGSMGHADGNSESGSSTDQSNSDQKSETGNSQEGTSGNGGTNDNVLPHSADESDVDEAPTPVFGPSPVRESRRCSRAEETKAVSVEDSRNDDLMPYPTTPSPGRRTKHSSSSTGKRSKISGGSVDSEEIGSPLTTRRMTRHEASEKKSRVADIDGDSGVESVTDPSAARRTKKRSRLDVTFSPGRLTRTSAANEELLSLPYYAKSPRKKSVRSPQVKQEEQTGSNQSHSPSRKSSRSEALGLPEDPGLECAVDTTPRGDVPVEADRRRTRSTSDAFDRVSTEPITETSLKTPERVLRNRKQGNPSPDNELSPNVSTTPLSSRKRKFKSSLGPLESPEPNRSKKTAATPSRVKGEHRTPNEERLSDEEFPKENEPMSPRSKSPKRMRITADNEIVQEALERGFDSKRLRSNTNFGAGDVFLNTQSMVENQRKKQTRITNFLPAKQGCRIKSPKEIHRMKSRYRNNKTTRCTSRSCSQMPANHIKNGTHTHSSSSCPDCKIHREKYENVSPQGQQKHVKRSPSHADRWNGIITRRDLGLRPLDSSSDSGPCYAAPGLSRSPNCCSLIAKFCSPTVS